ncbi:MAG: NADH-quinone oxidoreductase subunit C [Flavobacteriales bacterium]
MEKLNNEAILKSIQEAFPNDVLFHEEPYGLLTIEVSSNKAHEIIEWLKNHETLSVNYLTNIAGIHYPDDAGREFAVVYQLHSWKNQFRLRLKAYLAKENVQIPTLTDVFAGANWMERETFDFFGIEFVGHPDMRRILNEDSMDYFPMRKEHVLEDATREDKDDRYFGRFNN